MKKKLELKKEVVARLDHDQMGRMMGGFDFSQYNLCTTSCISKCMTLNDFSCDQAECHTALSFCECELIETPPPAHESAALTCP